MTTPGLAYLLSQLARCQMLRQADLQASIATADRALVLAERLDRVDLVADVLVTRGTALVSLGRGYEGLGCLETGLRLAQRHSLLPIEIRARMNLGGPLTDRDPRAAYDVSRGGLEVARRVGRALAFSMLTGNASVGAKEVGEWAWALEQIHAGFEAATSVEQRMTLLGFEVEFLVEQGKPATSELAESEAWILARVTDEPYLEGNLHSLRAYRAMQARDHAGTAREFLACGRLDLYNAVTVFSEAVFPALISRDRGLTTEVLAALDATGSHAAIGRLASRVGEAGLDALDGRIDAARSGLLAAYAGFADLGAVRRQALTGLVMASVLGDDDTAVRAAIDESRRLFERMGAGLWLAELDDALADNGGAQASADARG